jgi:hypothetical protein
LIAPPALTQERNNVLGAWYEPTHVIGEQVEQSWDVSSLECGIRIPNQTGILFLAHLASSSNVLTRKTVYLR